jgi:hypothetical protein
MSIFCRKQRISASPAPGSWRDGASIAVFDSLRNDAVNLAIWRRALPPDVQVELAAWAAQSSVDFDDIVPLRNYDVSSAMQGLREPWRTWFEADLTQLLTHFTRISVPNKLRITLRAVTTDRCRKFHADYVRYRLVTTYAGPGTHWVPDEAVRREVCDHPPTCSCDANREMVRDASAVLLVI